MKTIIASVMTLMIATLVHAADFPEISVQEVKAAIEGKSVTLLDVNGTDSWKQGHVPGALDFVVVKTNLASALPQDKEALIVAYCGNPKCKAYLSAATAAKQLGYKNVKHMPAGIQGWKKAGEKTEKGK